MATPWQTHGEWLRCQFHAHTTNSDGELAPRTLVKHFERAGYDVLAVTDHWHRSDPPSTGRTLVLPSAELNCLLPGGRDGHVLALGIADALEELAGERRSLAETGDWIAGSGGVAYLAHPYWTGVAPGLLELPSSIAGIEVYNAGCELECGRGLASVHWDELLVAGHRCHGLATDDTHHPGFDSDFAWTWVRADRDASSVLAALREGLFYASQGPLLHEVEVEAGSVHVACSPTRSLTLLTGVSAGTAVNAGRLGYAHGGRILATDSTGFITEARLDLPATASYARLEARDPAGRTAWTNSLV